MFSYNSTRCQIHLSVSQMMITFAAFRDQKSHKFTHSTQNSASFRPNHIISTKEDGWELSPFHHIRNVMETAQFDRKKRPLIRTKVCTLA